MRAAALMIAVIAAVFLMIETARATPLAATLSAANGAGTFDPTIDCPAGDGPSWRYAYSGTTTPVTGPLGGTWTSSIEVHDAGAGTAFVPSGGGRLSLTGARGTASLEFGQGGCADAAVALDTDPDGHPVAAGALPIAATGGSGALRGLTGSGTTTFTLGLGPGAGNAASIALTGDFTVRQPNLTVGTPTAYWRNLGDYLFHRLSVSVPILNSGTTATAGDAFAVRLDQAALQNGGTAGGVPANLGRIDAGAASAATVTFSNASPGRTYTLTTRVAGTDALDAALAPLDQSRSVKAPLLP